VSVRRPLARGDIVLVPFPFTDLTARKLRPALIVGRPVGDDLILAFISTRGAGPDPRCEHLVTPDDPEFLQTGLKGLSRFCLDKLVTLHVRLVQRRIGRIGPQTERAIARCLRYVLRI
jgi:mRNA interferase MazF